MSGEAVPMGLEVWLIGTAGEVDAAVKAIGSIGVSVEKGRLSLKGCDQGRVRRYLRVRVRSESTTTKGTTSNGSGSDRKGNARPRGGRSGKGQG